jgi:glycine/D-amino acid oxidase-like deaminating enzyme/nitrite reductase/ring-hydroxylating ferredoxin subunit
MTSDSGSSISVWMAVEVPHFPPLTNNTQADVCVVGAGIAGLMTAYLLTRAGQRVVVLEDGEIGSGETGRTTAHLTAALDDHYYMLERLHGALGARLAAESHSAAIEQLAAIVEEEQLACDFERVDGYLFEAPGDHTKMLPRELAALHRAGLTQVESVARAPLSDFDTGPALRYPKQAQFHPLKFLSGLAQAIVRRGGAIFTHTHVTAIEGGKPAQVTTGAGLEVRANAVVVATNTPVNDVVTIHTKQSPYRTYAIGLRVPPGAVPRALYWDTDDPYHYVRVTSGRSGAFNHIDDHDEVLIVGGEDHKTGQAQDAEARYTRLLAWTQARFPQAGEVLFRWSGQVMEPVDGVAFIGRNPHDAGNVYIATGDSGNGMTHGVIAGMLLTDLILGRENEWAKLYDPARVTWSAAAAYTEENLNVLEQYLDWVTGSEVNDYADIAPGQGAVVRHGVEKLAVYRDERGGVHEMSAVCTHLGCIVNWNGAEKTWDCPCHGSRYDAYGQVVNGPAIHALQKVETAQAKEAVPQEKPLAARSPAR